jgi:hypothetical protein
MSVVKMKYRPYIDVRRIIPDDFDDIFDGFYGTVARAHSVPLLVDSIDR